MSERAARPNSGARERVPEHTAHRAIDIAKIYRAEDALEQLGIGKHMARTMRRAGLKIIYSSGKSFLLGEDLADFLRGCRDGVAVQTTTDRSDDLQHPSHDDEHSARSEGGGS